MAPACQDRVDKDFATKLTRNLVNFLHLQFALYGIPQESKSLKEYDCIVYSINPFFKPVFTDAFINGLGL